MFTDFFKTSKAWQEEIVFTTVAAISSYEFSADAVIDSLVCVLTADDAPVAATMSEPSVVVLGVEPTTAEALTATFALTCSDPLDSEDYPKFPKWVLTKYSTVIIDGLRSRMQLQPAKPYSNQQLGVLNARKFSAGCASARTEVRHQNLYGGQRWTFPQFAVGSQR